MRFIPRSNVPIAAKPSWCPLHVRRAAANQKAAEAHYRAEAAAQELLQNEEQYSEQASEKAQKKQQKRHKQKQRQKEKQLERKELLARQAEEARAAVAPRGVIVTEEQAVKGTRELRALAAAKEPQGKSIKVISERGGQSSAKWLEDTFVELEGTSERDPKAQPTFDTCAPMPSRYVQSRYHDKNRWVYNLV